MKNSFIYFVALCGLLMLAGCSFAPVYESPQPTEPRAFAKFEFSTDIIISVGKIIAFDGDSSCQSDRKNMHNLFQISVNNFLIPNINMEGTWIRADVPLHVYALASGGTMHTCDDTAGFTPKAGGNYIFKFVLKKNGICPLEVLDAETKQAVEGVVKIPCK